jgi:hypothetical protein
MLVKIKGHSPERLEKNITAVMNVAAVICMKGYIPNSYDIRQPETSGKYWYERDGTYELFPSANNDKAFVRAKDENSITVEFYCRYDYDNQKKDALSAVINAFFMDVELVH